MIEKIYKVRVDYKHPSFSEPTSTERTERAEFAVWDQVLAYRGDCNPECWAGERFTAELATRTAAEELERDIIQVLEEHGLEVL